MNQEPRYQNPYELLTQEELDSITEQFQEHQRELSREYSLLQAARLKKYAERLNQQPETD